MSQPSGNCFAFPPSGERIAPVSRSVRKAAFVSETRAAASCIALTLRAFSRSCHDAVSFWVAAAGIVPEMRCAIKLVLFFVQVSFLETFCEFNFFRAVI